MLGRDLGEKNGELVVESFLHVASRTCALRARRSSRANRTGGCDRHARLGLSRPSSRVPSRVPAPWRHGLSRRAARGNPSGRGATHGLATQTHGTFSWSTRLAHIRGQVTGLRRFVMDIPRENSGRVLRTSVRFVAACEACLEDGFRMLRRYVSHVVWEPVDELGEAFDNFRPLPLPALVLAAVSVDAVSVAAAAPPEATV